MHGAQRPPGQYASQSASVEQMGSGLVQIPVSAQMHSVGMPTHAPQFRHGAPKLHSGQPGAQTCV
jgi:hypothetical protein